MRLPSDLREFVALLNSHKVEYLIVGAYALGFWGKPRYTGDLDVLIRPSPENASLVQQMLIEFGFGSLGVSPEDLIQEQQVIQLGFPPQRIDLLTSLSGVSFEEAWTTREPGFLDGLPVYFIGRESFVKNKRATGRPQDAADLAALGEADPHL